MAVWPVLLILVTLFSLKVQFFLVCRCFQQKSNKPNAANAGWWFILTILKNMKVNGKDYPIYEMDNKCQ